MKLSEGDTYVRAGEVPQSLRYILLGRGQTWFRQCCTRSLTNLLSNLAMALGTFEPFLDCDTAYDGYSSKHCRDCVIITRACL